MEVGIEILATSVEKVDISSKIAQATNKRIGQRRHHLVGVRTQLGNLRGRKTCRIQDGRPRLGRNKQWPQTDK